MEKEILDVIPENVEKEVNIEIETVNIDKGGTSNYVDLENKPSINDIELVGNKTLDELGIQAKGNYALKSEIPDTSDFITKEVNDLVYYYNKEYIDNSIGNINTILATLTTVAEATNGDN